MTKSLKKPRSRRSGARINVMLTIETFEAKLVENDPTFVVTSNQHARETRQALMIHQHDNINYFIDVKEQRITTNSAAVLSTLVAMNILKKISTEAARSRVVQWNLKLRDKTSKLH